MEWKKEEGKDWGKDWGKEEGKHWDKGCGQGFPFGPFGGKGYGHHFKHKFLMMAQHFPEMVEKIKAFMSTYVTENEENIMVEIDMPGFEKDNIDVKAGDYSLEVKAERDNSEEEVKLRGTEKKTFKTNLDLTSKVKVDEIKATYTNGVLRVVLKKEPEKTVEVD